ncbi:MAG: hypothetical protein WKF97_11820 [Chitinophagaceae bacterium]
MKTINLEKSVWTDDDFEQMGWHDNKMYAMAFGIENGEIIFDIDYILKWIDPEENENNFKFLIVPSTLVFRNVYDLNMNSLTLDVTVESIYRDNATQPKNADYIAEQIEYNWTIETTNGEITFKSVGYKQYARQKPRLLDSQFIDLAERGGISFDIVQQMKII